MLKECNIFLNGTHGICGERNISKTKTKREEEYFSVSKWSEQHWIEYLK
jgi:hypothetical protein